ncbi:MAG: GPW/gp25 family protein, partial [Holosporales bacterium]
MEREMEDMITRFEPRLRRVRVKVVELNRSENKLICTVSADMVMDQVH